VSLLPQPALRGTHDAISSSRRFIGRPSRQPNVAEISTLARRAAIHNIIQDKMRGGNTN